MVNWLQEVRENPTLFYKITMAIDDENRGHMFNSLPFLLYTLLIFLLKRPITMVPDRDNSL